MRQPKIISLFSDAPTTEQRPMSMMVSAVLHGAIFALVIKGVVRTPHVIESYQSQRFTLRTINLDRPDPRLQRMNASEVQPPARELKQAEQPSGGAAAPGSAASSAAASAPQLARIANAPQTLIQPDLPPDLLLPRQVPLPQLLLWSAENSTARVILAPPPQRPTEADLKPSILAPSHEPNLAEIQVSAVQLETEKPILLASTTSPAVVHGPETVPQAPQSASKWAGPPTPARVLSVSDINMAQGTIALLAANEIAKGTAAGISASGRLGNGAHPGNGAQSEGDTGQSKGQSSTAALNAGDSAGSIAEGQAAQDGQYGQGKPANATTPGSQKASAEPKALSLPSAQNSYGASIPPTRISLPKSGQFGVVVVGASLEERYPETAELWTGRMAATVYLRVGSSRNWILQYALPRAADASQSALGGALKAPWPYEILRPNFSAGDVDADAVMVHGFVNKQGQFEKLEVVYPPRFVQSQMVVNVLRDWQFRPASQNTQNTTVEVLLIIPNEGE
jgi:hypothetical protein